MPLNLEIKIKINSKKEFANKMNLLGAEFIAELNQKDVYFSYGKGLLKLRKQNDRYELIKYNRNEGKGERWSEYSILNLTGDNVEKYLTDILDLEVIVEKKRDLFIYKNTRIHLDKVKNLGEFLELETVVKDITQEKAKDEFNEVFNILQLGIEKEIRSSYRDLMLEL